MTSDKISYPTTEMKQVAKDIRTIVNDQWAKHQMMYKTHPQSLSSLTAHLSKGIPQGKGKALQDGLEVWNHKVEKCYDDLSIIADALESAAETMAQTDDDIKNLFKGFQDPSDDDVKSPFKGFEP